MQALATLRQERRAGHARALVSGLERWLAGGGIPRLVLLVPERAAEGGGGAQVAAAARQGLGFRPLDDMSLLAVWKAAFSNYHRDLMFGWDLWVKPLKA